MFRKPGDSSSSEDESSSVREEASTGADANPISRVNTIESTSSAHLSLTSGGTSSSSRPGLPRSVTGNNVKDLLLHSLLEEKALSEAAEHLGKSKTDPEVMALAQHTYQGLARELSTQVQVDETYASEENRAQRAAAQEGLSKYTRMHLTGLSQAANTLGHTVALGMSQALVTHPAVLRGPADSSSAFPRELDSLKEHYRRLPSSVQGHTAMHSNRYAQEYEEIKMVGKGGYGKVYKVKHKLDNAFYAVKRIVISTNKLQKIRERGDQELQSILEEVRSLARFDHNNIVRYHGAWMEFASHVPDANEVPSVRVTRSDRLIEHPSQASFDDSPEDPLRNRSESLGFDPFERSVLESGGIEFGYSDTGAGSELSAENSMMQLKGKGRARRASQATIATISSTMSRLSVVPDADEQEQGTISKTFESTGEESDSMVTDSEAPNQLISTRYSGPVLTLNIQMSLYENDLASYLSVEKESDLTHCFHPCVSLDFLDKIIGGVEYLHENNVVHRDLKPANIFLSFATSRGAPAGSVDLSKCCTCPQRQCVHVTPRIGDFGLVAEIESLTTTHVGTEFYRPAVMGKVDDKLDVFALGVIAFELLERFETKSERAHVLTNLKRGQVPDEFASGCSMQEMLKRMITGMVDEDGEKRWTCEEVRKEIGKILSALRA